MSIAPSTLAHPAPTPEQAGNTPVHEPAALPLFMPATDGTNQLFAQSNAAPMHPQTQSTLSPTAEFTRIFLLAWIIRYIFRGGAGVAFNEFEEHPGLRSKILNTLSAPGRWLQENHLPNIPLKEMENAAYATFIGVGSGSLSYQYSRLVKSDIQNIFSEAVAYENGKQPHDITFDDIQNSNNAIIRRTMANYHEKFWSRLASDGLFFIAAATRSEHITDVLLGAKGVQIFADTWKRKTTMFEDLITFVNNKINPRNGLGQQISVGEVFDLYQHYNETFNPDKMFNNVLERGTGEDAVWARNQPIFQRITELMNLTYAYKHSSLLDPKTGRAIHQADFALPKLIYMLGHDLIDVSKPEQTLTNIEIANRYGIGAVKEMQSMLHNGTTLAEINTRFPIAPHVTQEQPVATGKHNAVIAKGSTVQIDRPEMPATTVDSGTVDAALLQAAGIAHAIA